MIKQLLIFLFLLSGNAGYSQISDTLNDPGLFLTKIEKDINRYQVHENDWFCIMQKNHSWRRKANKIHFQIQLFHYGNFYSSGKTLHLSINNLSGIRIRSYSFNIDSTLILIDSLELPDNIPNGYFVLTGYIESPLNSNKILEERFVIDKSTDKFYFLSKKNSYYNNHYLDFFLAPTDSNGEYYYVLGVRARSKENIPQKINGYILKENFDTISAFETAKDGIRIISKASTKMDSMIVRVAWPDSMELDYDVPAVIEQPLLFETNLIDDTLHYKLWSTEAYSAKAGWLMIVGVWMDKILFSNVTNKTGKLYCFMDSFPLKNVSTGIIKLMIFTKGGKKIFEKNLCYSGNDFRKRTGK